MSERPAQLRYGTSAARWTLAAAILGSGMAALDGTVVGIALPRIGRDFHTGLESLQWVVTGYTLTLAGLLLFGGALGDRYGRRRLFVIGAIWFAAASLVCAVAPNAPTLVLARALQGVGGALLTPGSLAILQASFRPEDRSRAIGAWSGFGGVATAIGPFVGGYLIEAVSWRLVFLINLPVAAAVVLVSARHVPESHDPSLRGRLDLPGAGLATVGLIGITYGLIDGSSAGWSAPGILLALIGGAAALIGFVLREARIPNPMMALGLFRDRQFSAANAVTFVVYGALGATLFLLPVELQQVAGYSPLAAGAVLLPVTAVMLLLSARSGMLAARLGPRLQMSVGPLIIAVGLAMFARIDAGGSYLSEVLPASLVFGFGLATTVAPLTSTVLGAAPTEHAGMASAVNNDVARAAGLIAVAVLPVAAGLTGAAYLHPVQFEPGFRIAIVIASVICAAGGVLAAFTIRNPPRVGPGGESHCALDAPPLRGAPAPAIPAR